MQKYVIYEGEPHKGIWISVLTDKKTARKIPNGYILKYAGKTPACLKKLKSYTAQEIREYLKSV